MRIRKRPQPPAADSLLHPDLSSPAVPATALPDVAGGGEGRGAAGLHHNGDLQIVWHGRSGHQGCGDPRRPAELGGDNGRNQARRRGWEGPAPNPHLPPPIHADGHGKMVVMRGKQQEEEEEVVGGAHRRWSSTSGGNSLSASVDSTATVVKNGNMRNGAAEDEMVEREKKVKTNLSRMVKASSSAAAAAATTSASVSGVVKEEKGGDGSAAGRRKRRRSPAVLMEGSRCSRVNGRGWRCCQQTLVGYSLCEHHLGKGRLRSVSSVRCNGGKSAKKEEIVQKESTPVMAGAEEKEEEPAAKRRGKKIGMVKARSISSLLDQSDAQSEAATSVAMLPQPGTRREEIGAMV